MYWCHASWPNEKRYRPEICYTYSHWPYLKKKVFCFFEKISLTASSLEKMPCHADFPHISSIALFFYFWSFIVWFEAFTIQKLQIKHEIRHHRPKISLETKFQPIILKKLDSTFFLTTYFSRFWKLQFAVSEQSFSKIIIFKIHVRRVAGRGYS